MKTIINNLSAPTPLLKSHNLSLFKSGDDDLDEWLLKKALKNEKNRASKTFVVSESDSDRVLGYYCLSAGHVFHKDAYNPLKRNMPDPIPVITLGRLAVDMTLQGCGVGSALLRDALLRSLNVSQSHIAVKAVLVHAVNQNAITFYKERGFHSSPTNDATLMIGISEIKNAFKK